MVWPPPELFPRQKMATLWLGAANKQEMVHMPCPHKSLRFCCTHPVCGKWLAYQTVISRPAAKTGHFVFLQKHRTEWLPKRKIMLLSKPYKKLTKRNSRVRVPKKLQSYHFGKRTYRNEVPPRARCNSSTRTILRLPRSGACPRKPGSRWAKSWVQPMVEQWMGFNTIMSCRSKWTKRVGVSPNCRLDTTTAKTSLWQRNGSLTRMCCHNTTWVKLRITFNNG
mmetsp:Transcript_2703/g.5646  ORF Transcript_2703/g.5646 Transcript_2703/m.5646 type:complete len:223 (+) Transcript_2703:281-949(+)